MPTGRAGADAVVRSRALRGLVERQPTYGALRKAAMLIAHGKDNLAVHRSVDPVIERLFIGLRRNAGAPPAGTSEDNAPAFA